MIRPLLVLSFAIALASCQSSSNQSSYDPPPASYSDNSNSYGYTGNDGYNPDTGYAGESAAPAPAPAPAPQRRGFFSKLPHRDAAYIGLPLQEAQGLAQSRGLTTRVIMIDGVAQPGTVDVNPNRVNFKVKGGYVRAVVRG